MTANTQEQVDPKIYHPKQTLYERVILLSVIAYEALGCLSGGAMLTIAPDGSLMKMPVELMRGTFTDFLIPGIILLGLGILNTIAFFTVLRRSRTDWVWTSLALGGLIIWFWVEIIVIQEFHWLHAMWGLPVILGAIAAVPLFPGKTERRLLFCGIISSLWFIASDLIASNLWAEYSFTGQAFSELTAIEAPTRSFLVHVSGIPYNLLLIAFATGVWKISAYFRRKARLRIITVLILAHVVSGFCGGSLFPMHSRGEAEEMTMTDTRHIIFTAIEVSSMLLVLFLSLPLFNKRFRNYTLFTIALLVLGGGIAALYAPAVAANMPTPGLGIIERLNIYGFMIWLIVFAWVLRAETNTGEFNKSAAAPGTPIIF